MSTFGAIGRLRQALSGGGSSALTVTQANSFAVGDPVRHNGSAYVKAQGDTEENAEALGIVSAATATSFTLTTSGPLPIALPDGIYFLDPLQPGLTTIRPDTEGQVEKAMLRVIGGQGFVLDRPGYVLGASREVLVVSGVQVVSGDYTATSGLADRHIHASNGTITLPDSPDGTEKTITRIAGTVSVVGISGTFPEYVLSADGATISLIKQSNWRINMAYDP